MQDYDKAISIDPNFVGAYVNRVVAYDKKGEVDNALADYNRTIQLDPNSAIGYFSRGTHYYDHNNCDSAIEDFSIAIQKKLKLASQLTV